MLRQQLRAVSEDPSRKCGSIDSTASAPSRVLAAAFVTLRIANFHRLDRNTAQHVEPLNHHSKALAPSAIPHLVVTTPHDPITKFWSLALAILLFASKLKKAAAAATPQSYARW